MQVGAKEVVALASSGNMKEQVHACVDVGETFATNVIRSCKKKIDIIKEPKIVPPNAVLKQENVQPRVENDGGDIELYSLQLFPHPSSLFVVLGFLFVNFFVAIHSLIVVFKPLSYLPFPCEKVGGAFFRGLIL